MAYELYSTKKVFSIEALNVACNKLVNAVLEEFTITATNSFCITGDVARAIAGEEVSPIKCIAFITDREAIYKYFVANLEKLVKGTGRFVYTNRIQYRLPDCCLEIWLATEELTVVDAEGIIYQDLEQIPENIN